jgi:hypothetical protein
MSEAKRTFRITDLISSRPPPPVLKLNPTNEKLFTYEKATNLFNTMLLQNLNQSFLDMVSPKLGQSKGEINSF